MIRIRFSGFGGQGIVLLGYIFGNAAVADNKIVIQTQSYGSESRGGECKSDVVISEQPIYELELVELDVLVAMSQLAYNKYISQLKSGGSLFIDADLVTTSAKSPDVHTYSVRATYIADTEFNRKIVANMVMLGFVTAILRIVSKSAVCTVISQRVPKGTEALNISAFEYGYKLGIDARAS
jgi:2-oxoglutarate ferredoxin oxidoreductase subunit gamma